MQLVGKEQCSAGQGPSPTEGTAQAKALGARLWEGGRAGLRGLYPQATSGGRRFYWKCKGAQVLAGAQEARKEAWAAERPLPILAEATSSKPRDS